MFSYIRSNSSKQPRSGTGGARLAQPRDRSSPPPPSWLPYTLTRRAFPALLPPGPRRLHTYTTHLHSWFTAAMPRSAYVCVLPIVLPALAWPPTAPRRSGELIIHGTAMLYLLAACTGRHVLCALHTLVEQLRGPARLAQLSWPSRGAPGYPAPLHGLAGLWVNLVVLLHALHARQPLHWAASTALVSSWRSQLLPPSSLPRAVASRAAATGRAASDGAREPAAWRAARARGW